MKYFVKYLFLLGLFATSCQNSKCRENAPDSEPITLKVFRTEDTLFKAKSQEEVAQYFKKYPEIAQYLWHIKQYPHDSVLYNKIWKLRNNKSVDTVFLESMEAFSDFTSVTSQLTEGIGRLQNVFPKISLPTVYTTVSVFYNDLYVSDSLIIIGLEHFIGDDATYAPQDIPEYILERYDKEHLATLILQFLAGEHIMKGEENTLLSAMIDYGKTHYVTSRLLPCVADSIIMGYSSHTMAGVYANEGLIWGHFMEKELLYELSPIEKRKYLSDRPFIYEISNDCPGRIGAWIGWQIVESYMKNNQVSIPELIKNTQHHAIFAQSGYKPKMGI